MADATRIVLRTAEPKALGEALGMMLGSRLNRATINGARAALHLGPDEWLVVAPPGEASALLAAGARAAAIASVVDVSHRSVTIPVAGPHAVEMLNAFIALDLAEVAFPAGMCTRTLFGKAEVILWRTGVDAFRLDVWRSFSPYVLGCLAEAGREFGEPLFAPPAESPLLAAKPREV